jgi:hypothetical protein
MFCLQRYKITLILQKQYLYFVITKNNYNPTIYHNADCLIEH